MNKKEWLDFLFYKIGKQNYDFKVCGLRKKDEEVISTKWRKYSEVCFPIEPWEDWKIKWVNQRQMLPTEIILDLDDKELLSPCLDELKSKNLIFYAYRTGSKGFHISVFFDKEVSEVERLGFIKHFRGDTALSVSSHMIALENCPHWKSGETKGLINGN